ncbi:MAG TPA: hypothetical protein DDX51_01605 [Clostridiales bacterium]|nr:hypothetical protein [Clostridiales bacterium]
MKHSRKPKVHPLFKALLVLVVAFSCFRLVSLQLQVHELQTEYRVLQDEVEKRKQANQDLKDSMDEKLTDEEIARIAREVLGYASPGERIFVDSSEQ